jgi:hypothetical protein
VLGSISLTPGFNRVDRSQHDAPQPFQRFSSGRRPICRSLNRIYLLVLPRQKGSTASANPMGLSI